MTCRRPSTRNRRAPTARCIPAWAISAPVVVPRQQDLRRAAEVLNAGKKVAILVGAGALHATDEVIAVAEQARRRCRQGAARQGGAARRSAVGHRLDRPARHQAELGDDERVRHAADDRLGLSLFGVPAEGGAGARRADRHRAGDAEPALSDGGQPAGRRRGDAARAVAAAGGEAGPVLASAGSRRTWRIGGRCWRAAP